MDNDTLREALAAATSRVLEDAAFVFTEPAAGPIDEASWPGSVIQARISFTGPIRGSFLLAAPSGLCGVLAADMVGESEADEESKEVLGEILNMVASITLEQALEAEPRWNLGLPEVRSESPAEHVSGPRSDVWIRLLTEEEEPIEVGVFLEKGDG